MAELKSAFDTKATENKNFNDNLDYFFTQRKVTEYEDILDSNMNRKKNKIIKNYNFLKINLPFDFIKKKDTNDIQMEIWGDKGYFYTGRISENEGIMPHLLIRLNGDSQIFVKLYLKNEDTVISFIQVPKRYQVIPNLDSNKLQNENDSSIDTENK